MCIHIKKLLFIRPGPIRRVESSITDTTTSEVVIGHAHLWEQLVCLVVFLVERELMCRV
jgi:hypothetical protein